MKTRSQIGARLAAVAFTAIVLAASARAQVRNSGASTITLNAVLTDSIGNRLSGTPQLDRAIQWATEEMKRDGLENVHTEKAMVPKWVRGAESAEILEPARHPIAMLGLRIDFLTRGCRYDTRGRVALAPQGVTAEPTAADLLAIER